MKFLIDQNANHEMPKVLRAFYGGHTFDHAYDKGWGALKDVDLFDAMAADGYNALVTRDGNQLRIPHERDAMRNNRIHWIGYNTPKSSGILAIALETSTVLAALPFIITAPSPQPMAYRLKGVGAEPGQRFTASLL